MHYMSQEFSAPQMAQQRAPDHQLAMADATATKYDALVKVDIEPPTSPSSGGGVSSRKVEVEKQGLMNVQAMMFLILWYIFSAFTLFLNKYILTTLKGEPTLLGAFQMLMTLICGFIQMFLPCGMYKKVHREGKPANFIRNMVLVGIMRFSTVVLGLVALKFVAVSFTETVKSSAPIFTVLIAKCLLGEETGVYVMVSLVPIMSGLALCSAPAELQFYTSLASVIVQIPACAFLMDFNLAKKTMDETMLMALVLNGVCFHFQSITAYALMGFISPVTHSVANTVKRAFLIWTSVFLFGNPVTMLSGLGTVIVTIGVFMYNKARELDDRARDAKAAKKLESPNHIQDNHTQ